MSIKTINNKEEFITIINNGYTFVDFYTTWCGPCKMLAPIVEQISTQFKDINFLKVDIDQFSDIAQMFFIQSIPTIYLFKDGKPLNHFVGFKPVTEIIEFIKQNKKSK